MPKIVFIGAGSTIFARNLIGDILSFPALQGCTLTLMDIDEERLRTSEIVAHKINLALGAKAVVEATTNRRVALTGADYVVTMFQVAGYEPGTVIDFEIPKKYGLRQTIADTLGIGGIMRALRTIPVLLDICRDMADLCPDAWMLQYVNPMAMNCWAIDRATEIKTVGLCHSVQGTAQQLATDLGVPFDEMRYLAAGINHMAFYLKLEHAGQDLYPRLRAFSAENDAPIRLPWGHSDAVRYEMFKHLGYFVTESSEHFSEYVPWFIKRDRPDLIEQFNIPLDEYIRRCQLQILGWQMMRADMEKVAQPIEVELSEEYGARIIDSIETGTARVIYGNVANRGLIDNLPAGCCVEVPCLVDANGVQPTVIGRIPPHLAALMRTNVNVQELTVEAALTGKREHIYHAAMLDPHTAAELSLDQIVSLVDELIEAHGDWLPQYRR
jgi:alpha-galactosidase